jgi:hypothetical protein
MKTRHWEVVVFEHGEINLSLSQKINIILRVCVIYYGAKFHVYDHKSV